MSRELAQSMRRFLADHHGRDGCWLWSRSKNSDGYGLTKIDSKTTLAHRAAWQALRGQLTAEQYLCHRCDEPSCCNPAHLFIGDAASNYADSRTKGRASIGERVGTAKLTPAQVREIRASNDRQIDLADRFGVGQTTIAAIKTRQNWKHLS